jgi:pimeloyl-ACP methyl ester carboxylesterase
MALAELGDDLTLAYDLVGAGEPLMLISGLGVQRGVWFEVVEALGGSFQVLTYDLRGYGLGDRGLGDRAAAGGMEFTIADLAQDALRLIEHLDLGPVHLMGHSQGGFIALEAVLARPDLVRSLVVAGSASYTDEYGRRVLRNWRNILLEQGQPGFYQNLLLWQFSPDYFNDRTRELDVLEKWLRRAPFDPETYLAHNLACETHETRERLRAVRVPTLLLGGAEDRVMGLRHNRLLHQLIADSRVITLERLGHDLFVESPERTIPLVEDFLQTVRSPRVVSA